MALDHELALIIIRTEPKTRPRWAAPVRGSLGRRTVARIKVQQRANVTAIHQMHGAPVKGEPKYLPAIVDDTPCDGSHGRFCPECASITRNRR